ncbi:hypothetical protein VP1G_08050 [Cytospora mali]|uniref:Uncharacterized protein n=1 Tax=Cytospora mali TaxID=578113 RepID=A0A194VAG2_CYTMA|nr:hypothetical protein VP1G_08050 [Valsa mali var. pyri (nom. inval.)]
MVSFFGIKFGADKKKKEPEQAENSLYAQQWKASREGMLRQQSGLSGAGANSIRPSTSQGAHAGAKSHTSVGSSGTWDAHNTEFRGSAGAGFVGTSTSVTAGPGPLNSHSLKGYGSEANLKLSLGTRNGSSSSLAGPRLPFGGSSGGRDTGPRPGSAHSMRQDRGKPLLKPLDVHVLNESTPGIAGPPRSPLGQFELMSPVSDNESLLGDEPDKIAKDIANRIAREEEQSKMKVEIEERNRAQAELRAQAMRNVEATRPTTAKGYPSPPASIASIQGERDASSVLVPGQKSNLPFKGPAVQDSRPGSRGRDVPNGSLLPTPGPRIQQPVTERGRSDSRGRPPPSIELPLPSPRAPPRGTSAGSDPRSVSRGRSQTTDNLSPGSSMLRPQGSREPVRGATVPAVRPPPRSPLFQQSSHLDLNRVDGHEGDKLKVDERAKNDPYGIPSPPLSNGQRSSGEVEGRPVIRTVQAKRDTLVVGVTQRESLGLQIDEFEKTLQQAQAMTALEKGPEAMMNVSGARSRGNSDGSSNYSDISESPMTIEPPLISPQPFPLTPRPMSPATRSSKPNLAEILQPTRRPTLEERSESPAGSSRSRTTTAGSIRSNTADSLPPRRPTLEIRPESPANRPIPRGAAPPRRPTLEEYGNIKINTASSMANRWHHPSPDEYDGRNNLVESPDRTDSPILKNVRNVFSPEQMSDVPSSADTSRSNSPIAHHSVFSPPPPPKKTMPPRSVRPEWDLGPAPTAPPTTPLPIPEKNARRKNTAEAAAQKQLEVTRILPPERKPSPAPFGLASSASIVPDTTSNPNWPLPGPGSTSSGPEGSFSARRSLLPDKRAPPAPLNIAATKYADDMGVGIDPGPTTLDVNGSEDVLGFTPIMRPQTASREEAPRRKDSLIRAEVEFLWREERTTVYNTAEEDFVDQQPAPAPATSYDVADKSSVIGVARGLSLKYDQMREQEKRARARDRMKAMRAWTIEETPGSTSPPTGEWAMHELSPTGIADEHGTGFI